MNNKRNILLWIIILLVATNVTTIATIIYHNYSQQEIRKTDTLNQLEIPNKRIGRFFKEQLNLSFEQNQKFREFRQIFHSESNRLTSEMQLKRKEFLNELGKANSDTVYLNKLSNEIGNLHTDLKHITYQFYIEMKSVCNEEQKAKLFEIFNSMANQEIESKMPNNCLDGIKK